ENLDKVGKPASEGGIDKTTVVNAGDLKNLADTPLFFSGDAADDKEYNGAKNTKNTFGRKLSEEAKIVGGQTDITKLTDNNIGVVSNGTDTLTIKLAKDLTDLHSVTTTDDKGNTTQINGKGLATTTDDGKGNIKITTVTSDGITIVTTDKDGNNSVSLTNKGLDNGHHQIINVKSGLLDRQGKPVTLKEASGDILNNAVNVKDLRDVVQGLTDSGKGGGFGLTGNNGEVSKSLGETITLKGGIANKVENGRDMNKPEKATTDKNTYIDVKTSKNGSEKIMVVEIAKDLTDLNSAEFTDQEGNTTKMKGDGIYIDKNGDGNADISLTSEGLNNGGNKITNVADGTEDTDAVNVSQLNKLKQEIKQNIGDEINELNAYAPVVYTDKNGNRVIRKGNKFVKKNDETAEIPPQDIRLSLVNADGKTTNPSTLQNVAKGVNKTDAVNVEQLEEATEKPLTFNGDAGSSSAKLGETVAIKGGANSADLTDNNIGVIANSSTKTLNVKLSKKLKGLESAEFVDNNGNTTNITGDGVHISGGNGSNVSLTSQGLNNGGNRITNVAPGVEATDAVNVSQLNQVGAALHNRINNVAKGAYGGVASAGAMASLPQAYLPGKSMVAAGASHYRGESAVALGASRISDNGKIILKLNASHNTSGNTMVGAGVGYQF
ncbi:YadA family autotransporter adhesin, partial [Gallibacterium anatis]